MIVAVVCPIRQKVCTELRTSAGTARVAVRRWATLKSRAVAVSVMVPGGSRPLGGSPASRGGFRAAKPRYARRGSPVPDERRLVREHQLLGPAVVLGVEELDAGEPLGQAAGDHPLQPLDVGPVEVEER